MRTLFFALLLLNAAFFGWAQWIDAPDAAPGASSSVVDRRLPTLALVSPAPATPAVSAAVSRATPAVPAQALATRCRSLGPFIRAATASAVLDQLRARSLTAQQRSVDIEVNDGYAVYMDQLGGDAAQRRALARLSRAGLDQAKLEHPAGQAARLLVGVFADQTQAVRHAEQVRQLGFKPVLEVHQSTLSAYWLDIALPTNEPEPSVGQLTAGLADAEPSVVPAVSFTDCPAKGATAQP